MKKLFTGCLLACACLCGCQKYLPRNYYTDPNGNGVSVFTSRSYNIMSAYVNSDLYVNPYICDCYIFSSTWYNSPVSVVARRGGGVKDTLYVSWQIKDSTLANTIPSPYDYLTLLVPVKGGFTKSDFAALGGQRFVLDTANGVTAVLSQVYGRGNTSYNPYYLGQSYLNVSGPAGVYFTQVQPLASDTLLHYQFSGLFEANINDSLRITKGLFDFRVNASDLNF
jgi:hypothetical protein